MADVDESVVQARQALWSLLWGGAGAVALGGLLILNEAGGLFGIAALVLVPAGIGALIMAVIGWGVALGNAASGAGVVGEPEDDGTFNWERRRAAEDS